MNIEQTIVRPPATPELRTHLHGMWAAVAPAWRTNADYGDARAAALTERMVQLAELRPGARVLELACGAGGVGLAAADRVGPDGQVTVSDVVPEMTAIAAERAGRRGLANVRARVLDLEEIDEPDASYDAVVCREGLMFAADPRRAAADAVRVLRPGGRLVAAVWAPREQNPWLGLVFDTVSATLGKPVPPPGIPGPFALSDENELAAILGSAGLDDVAIEEHAVTTTAASPEEWWSRACALAGPLATLLASLDEDTRAKLRSAAVQAANPYRTSDGVVFPGLTLIASGRRP